MYTIVIGLSESVIVWGVPELAVQLTTILATSVEDVFLIQNPLSKSSQKLYLGFKVLVREIV
jgi:hypothetical protein